MSPAGLYNLDRRLRPLLYGIQVLGSLGLRKHMIKPNPNAPVEASPVDPRGRVHPSSGPGPSCLPHIEQNLSLGDLKGVPHDGQYLGAAYDWAGPA